MKKRKDYTYVILWAFLVVAVIAIAFLKDNPIKGSEAYEVKPDTSEVFTTPTIVVDTSAPSDESMITQSNKMIGVWISYISLSNHDGTEASFKANFDAKVAEAKSMGATDLFVQVRPFSDALYDSDYYPWSHIITGKQGQYPGFDPLLYMTEKTHAEGMKIHAWLNPLRVKLETTPPELSADNPYVMLNASNPYYFIEKDGAVYINPAYREMRSLIASGAAEIVTKYDVDGIHFDDYFYPEGMTSEDSVAYENYCASVSNPLPIEEWRKTNINSLIAQVYREVKEADPEAVFGISPSANLQNNEEMAADVYTWCAVKGYIDYIAPQIYFSYDNPYLGFSQSLNEWMSIPRHDELDIYIGLAVYKAGTNSDEGTWLTSSDILAREAKESFDFGADGIILYEGSYISAPEAETEIQNLRNYLSTR